MDLSQSWKFSQINGKKKKKHLTISRLENDNRNGHGVGEKKENVRQHVIS